MTALLISPSGPATLEREDLVSGLSEHWLQELLHGHPQLIPLDEIEPGTGRFIPVVRELAIAKPGGTVFLDLFGLTAFGRPVLIECKLWRNPQARREVIAQILEYAALLRRWSYADLTARLKPRLDPALAAHQNPLFELARHGGSPLSEASFTDAVSANLRQGDFHLLIAGDGIREDMMAIAEHIGDSGARLALIEFRRWSDGNGNVVVTPHVPFRTQVVRQRVLVDGTGAALTIEEEGAEERIGAAPDTAPTVASPERQATLAANRAFWQRFIDTCRFDHPDQPPPRHGGNNWAKIPLPEPARWITAYRWNDPRWKGRAGLTLVEQEGADLFARLAAMTPEIEMEMAPFPVRWGAILNPSRTCFSLDEPLGCTDTIGWLCAASNRMVSVLRPVLADLKA
ncbi:hypothetical protein [Paracoccus sanguinis]|uniref:hypothetical protein n=1 Tax=Paracoccus sanguinis TaxID=1545044 RepID=UPI00068C957D|nr:hypothetical protein [Paracoccus sanguinis]